MNIDPRKNDKGYPDPTPYKAIKNMEKEEERLRKLIHTIRYVAGLAGFDIEGRIVLVDRKTGRVWR